MLETSPSVASKCWKSRQEICRTINTNTAKQPYFCFVYIIAQFVANENRYVIAYRDHLRYTYVRAKTWCSSEAKQPQGTNTTRSSATEMFQYRGLWISCIWWILDWTIRSIIPEGRRNSKQNIGTRTLLLNGLNGLSEAFSHSHISWTRELF